MERKRNEENYLNFTLDIISTVCLNIMDNYPPSLRSENPVVKLTASTK